MPSSPRSVLIVGATGVLIELQDALNTVWKVVPKPGRGIKGLIRDRLLSFSIVLGFGFLEILFRRHLSLF